MSGFTGFSSVTRDHTYSSRHHEHRWQFVQHKASSSTHTLRLAQTTQIHRNY
jgi:hypothetical protein